MSDQQALSQEEIDALFRGGNQTSEKNQALTNEEADALGEIGNISFGSAATALSTLLQQRVEITTPSVSIINAQELPNQFPKPYVLVTVEYTVGLKGSNALAIELDDAKTIADLMLGGDGTNISGELNELHLSAVGEAMNQMMGGASTSMSQIFGSRIDISPPNVRVVDLTSDDSIDLGFKGWLVNVEFALKVGELIDSRIMQLMPLQFADELLNKLGFHASDSSTENMSPEITDTVSSQPSANLTAGIQEEIPNAAKKEVAASAEALKNRPSTTVQRPEFVDFGGLEVTSHGQPRNLELLFDVPLNITVELGRTKRMIREVLDLAPGSIFELDKLAGEPVDILVNNKKIATGEVVVIDENFGVRVTDIISPSERVRNL
ncbi:flagellar motor switch phosphatase FliY [Alicyclobacillus tolerans]|uniref:Flagellar motor switch protein FliN/FliY n=1 Tax=Alicyclobacillus tolerans TaxID=90970 RepID=A0A1M6RP67_9BACL|nr:flagellar motor switch phosphatase FliY [Alicyclobacillus montanus]SHK34245.1 flagellar motor switch protein FliN/FliY [Alicyclobacillus montanus]